MKKPRKEIGSNHATFFYRNSILNIIGFFTRKVEDIDMSEICFNNGNCFNIDTNDKYKENDTCAPDIFAAACKSCPELTCQFTKYSKIGGGWFGSADRVRRSGGGWFGGWTSDCSPLDGFSMTGCLSGLRKAFGSCSGIAPMARVAATMAGWRPATLTPCLRPQTSRGEVTVWWSWEYGRADS